MADLGVGLVLSSRLVGVFPPTVLVGLGSSYVKKVMRFGWGMKDLYID